MSAVRPSPPSNRTADLRPEQTLLLASARTHLDDACRAQLRALAARDLEWDLFLNTANRHGVAPLVFNALTASGAIDAADARVARLLERFAVNAGNSVMLARQLLEVLALLERDGIPAIAYKGPVLATLLYGNLALREFTDLDVLVHRNDVVRAGEALVSHGYEPELTLTPSDERLLLRTRAGYFRRFDRPLASGRVVLELHWRIPATFRLDEDFWQRVTSVGLLDRHAAHFAPEDLALILCAHGFKHGWSQLKWLCDVSELVTKFPVLDWDRAIRHASQVGGLRVLLLGCALARSVLAIELPAPIADRVDGDSIVSELAEIFRARLFDDGHRRRVGIVCNLRVRERVQDRIRYGLSLLDALTVPSMKDRMEWRVQRRPRLMARVTHPFRVVRRAAGKYHA